MLTFLLVPLLAAHSSAQYAGCPETYGVQVYPHEQYCDKFYKCVNGKTCICFVRNALKENMTDSEKSLTLTLRKLHELH